MSVFRISMPLQGLIILENASNCVEVFIIKGTSVTSSESPRQSIRLYERFARINEKTVKITSGTSIPIRQNIALIDNFDVRFWKFV